MEYAKLTAMQTGHRGFRVAVASIMHESNSFNAAPTTLGDFHFRGEADSAGKLRDWATGNSEVAGFLEEGARAGFELLPGIYAQATPAGPVAADAFETLTARLNESISTMGAVDGILLALHGAMFTEAFPQADEEIVRRLRRVAPRTPLVLTHDFHANISPEIVEMTDALITYQQNPHVDTKQRGVLAASLLRRMLEGEIRPRQFLVKPPVLWNIIYQNTSSEPLKPVTDASIDLEAQPGILAASVAAGYQYNDVPYVGPSVIVVTDGDADRAEREAQRLGEMMWSRRDTIRLDLPNAATAVREAARGDRFPVALFDVGDNIGGGGTGGETAILEQFLRQRAQGWVAVIHDAEAVATSEQAGVGGRFDCEVGGRAASSATHPVRVRGTVRSLHDGRFLEPAVRHGGHRYWRMGHCAVIEEEHSTRDEPNYLLLTSERTSPFSLHQLLSCGIAPERQRIIAVKGTVAPRAAYEPIAARIQLVDTPGATSANPAHFTFRRARPGIAYLNA